jgi:hypothetical protein
LQEVNADITFFYLRKKNEDATCREDARLTGDELG